MNKLQSWLILAAFLSGPGCNDSVQRKDERGSGLNNISGCYIRVSGRDTLVAVLQQQDSAVSGKLFFDNHGYDGSSGQIRGTRRGNIIRLHYFFEAEGMNNVMEIVFRADSTAIIRGSGEMNIRGDTTYFVSPAEIVFRDEDRLIPISCNDLPEKFR